MHLGITDGEVCYHRYRACLSCTSTPPASPLRSPQRRSARKRCAPACLASALAHLHWCVLDSSRPSRLYAGPAQRGARPRARSPEHRRVRFVGSGNPHECEVQAQQGEGAQPAVDEEAKTGGAGAAEGAAAAAGRRQAGSGGGGGGGWGGAIGGPGPSLSVACTGLTCADAPGRANTAEASAEEEARPCGRPGMIKQHSTALATSAHAASSRPARCAAPCSAECVPLPGEGAVRETGCTLLHSCCLHVEHF
jgi:hypothetical protein